MQLAPLIRELCSHTRLPVIAKPNAGMPDPLTGAYDMGPAAFAKAMLPCLEAGASILGGCCGTDPAYIQALAQSTAGKLPAPRPAPTDTCYLAPQRRPPPGPGAGDRGTDQSHRQKAVPAGPAGGGSGLYPGGGHPTGGRRGGDPGCERGLPRGERGGDAAKGREKITERPPPPPPAGFQRPRRPGSGAAGV